MTGGRVESSSGLAGPPIRLFHAGLLSSEAVTSSTGWMVPSEGTPIAARSGLPVSQVPLSGRHRNLRGDSCAGRVGGASEVNAQLRRRR
jgi:hypothetical protein